MSRSDAYYCVAFWYQMLPRRTFSSMPLSSERVSGDKIHMLEAELLKPQTGSPARVKNILVDGATVVEYTPASVGDAVVFTFYVGVSGWYEISGFFAQSSGHGIYRVVVDDETMRDSVDFYKGEGGTGRHYLQRSDEIPLGKLYLVAGLHAFRFEAKGSREEADGMLLGIDSLLVRPVPKPGE